MRLNKFRITNFRSIVDSGWVNCANVTVFAGDNESGKTSLFFALLKFMNDDQRAKFLRGRADMTAFVEIDYKLDVPFDRADELMPRIESVVFAEVELEVDAALKEKIKEIDPACVLGDRIVVSKTYGGIYAVNDALRVREDAREEALALIVDALPRFQYYQEVSEVSSEIDLLNLALKTAGCLEDNNFTAKEAMFLSLLNSLDIWESNVIKSIEEVYGPLTAELGATVDFTKVLEAIPLFERRIKRGFEQLNEQFIECWGKNDVSISYEGYNRGLIIKIIDRRTLKEYRLKNRSTGFRRFFAHFLTFSVTSVKGASNDNAVLMFDEAGAAMHSLTQKKLAEYFIKISEYSQIMYNTHTSYMIPVKHMNNVRVVYKDGTNHTTVTDRLVVTGDRTNEFSIFPVQSALALYVAEKSLAGCLPVIVLNEEDEAYLSLIKNILISKGKFQTIFQSLIFPTGENGMDATCEVFSDGADLPIVVLASDKDGDYISNRLLNGKYRGSPQKVRRVSDYIKGARYMEDLMPVNFIEVSARLYLKEILGSGFSYNEKQHASLIDAIESYASKQGILLPKNYRAEIAKRTKINMMSYYENVYVPHRYVDSWAKLWKDIIRLSE